MSFIAINLIKLYQYCLSPWVGSCCRFYPSCSEYSKQAFQKHGVVLGVGLSLWRVLRCHPFAQPGEDQVPDLKGFYKIFRTKKVRK